MRRLAIPITAALALAALVPPATADTGVVTDPPATDVPVNADILRLAARNGESAVRVKVRLADLDPDRRARVKVLVDPAPKDGTQYIVESVKRPGREGRSWLLLAIGMDFGGTRLACDGIRGAWDLDRGTVSVRVPQSCLPENGRMATFKASTVYGERGDWTDFLRVRKGSAATA